MRLLLPILLILTGCGFTPRCINPGADWTITVANRADLTAEFLRRGGEGYVPNATQQDGFTDRVRKEIWIVGTPNDALVIKRFIHEREFHGPDHFAARVWTPHFDVMYGDADPDERAVGLALQAARQATAELTPVE